ncbi:MAG: hypothetical protein FGM23_07725, partial [Alphaproteobacteria bacterium]|nr:hypothetical protein [Alphaproteobacteria bacterium]
MTVISQPSHQPTQGNRMIRKNPQGGFAIGVIFATLLAIALLLGYLSLSGQNALRLNSNTDDRKLAMAVQQNGLKLKNGMDRFLMMGTIKDDAIYAYKISGNDPANCSGAACLWNRPQNFFGPMGSMNAPVFDPNVYEISNAVTCVPNDLAGETASFSIDSGSGSCVSYVTRVRSTSNFYSNTVDDPSSAGGTINRSFIVFYTGPIKTKVCQQLNNLLWGT